MKAFDEYDETGDYDYEFDVLAHESDADDLRPRSRLILQELAEQRTENDSFQRIKSKVSANAFRGIGVLICAVLLSALFLQFLRSNSAPAVADDEPTALISEIVTAGETPAGTPSPQKITVHVAGAVKQPGVYELDFGQRVQHAIEMAGGAREEAELNAINLAQPVADGQQIYVPVAGETPVVVNSQSASNQAKSSLIDVNTATAAELEELPRVGPATAQKIVDYREQNGKFSNLNDLLAIPGIGEKTIQSFEGLVTFS